VKALIILSVALACLAVAAPARAQGTGNDLLESCRSLLDPNYNVADNVTRNLENARGLISAFNRHETRGMCLGIVGAVREVMDLERKAPPGPVKFACVPYEVTNGQLVRVVVAFADKHPDLLHHRLSGLAVLALAEAWPCSK
jgi:hypothetical protein